MLKGRENCDNVIASKVAAMSECNLHILVDPLYELARDTLYTYIGELYMPFCMLDNTHV